jgi:hypothetical protein
LLFTIALQQFAAPQQRNQTERVPRHRMSAAVEGCSLSKCQPAKPGAVNGLSDRVLEHHGQIYSSSLFSRERLDCMLAVRA